MRETAKAGSSYYQQRRLHLYRQHRHLAVRLQRDGLSDLQIEDALEAAERERVLDLVGLDYACDEGADDE